MTRNQDNSPIDNTCPLIDEVINGIEEADWGDDWYYGKEHTLRILEDVRQANTDLREWGNEEYDRAEEMERERNALENENHDLGLQVDELNMQIDDRDEEIRLLNDEIARLEDSTENN